MTELEKSADKSKESPEMLKKDDDLMVQIREALKQKSNKESLKKVGDLLYETFKTSDYSAEVVLSSIREVYLENRGKFKPKLSFNGYLKSFGEGMVKLCQEKLHESDLDLGTYGVDGKLGKFTSKALDSYYGKKPAEKVKVRVDADKPKIEKGKKKIKATVEAPNAAPSTTLKKKAKSAPVAKVIPEKPLPVKAPESVGLPEKGKITPKAAIEAEVKGIYGKYKTDYFVNNLESNFGKTKSEVQRYIVDRDPVTGGQLTFLGRPINGGINILTIPFFKIAEEELKQKGVTYKPQGKTVGGFAYRGMKFGGKESNTPSFHKTGLAFDVDAGTNGPADKRGNIPDEVVFAMTRAGFAWGEVGHPDFSYLGNDAMHFQLRVDPKSADGQSIINSSPEGKKYWAKVQPMLADIEKSGSKA